MKWHRGLILFFSFLAGLYFAYSQWNGHFNTQRKVASDSAHLTQEDIINYSKRSDVLKMVSTAMATARGRGSSGQCLDYVLRALNSSGVAPRWWASGQASDYNMYAKYSIPHLEERNFLNLLSAESTLSAEDAPVGSILVYSGRSPTSNCRDGSSRASPEKDCGHIEIRTENGYVSDFYSTQPITAIGPYKLIGIMIQVKPE